MLSSTGNTCEKNAVVLNGCKNCCRSKLFCDFLPLRILYTVYIFVIHSPYFSTGKQCSKGIGYYTQLVWQDTTHVGCGWTQFKYRGFPNYFENFLVCNYGPSANVWKQPVYDIANSTCNCPCIGCNPKTGLCPPNCKFAVWADWAGWSDCSASCGGGNRKRERLCKESLFPPGNAEWTKRSIDTYGSLSLIPPFWTNERSVDVRKILDPKLCKRGEPSEMGTCNRHPCPGMLDCPLSKGNQAPHPKFERPNRKILKSKICLTSVKNWCVQLT